MRNHSRIFLFLLVMLLNAAPTQLYIAVNDLQAKGLEPVKEDINIEENIVLKKEYTLEHTKACLDSVEIVRKAARVDSILQAAKSDIKDNLPDMFAQLVSGQKAGSIRTVAVLPFSMQDSISTAGRMVAEYGIVFFTRRPDYRVVDRADFTAIMAELELSQSDLVSQDKALETGTLLSAELIVTGTVTEAMDKRMIFSRMIHVETAEIVSAASAEMKVERMEEFYRDALCERSKLSSAIFRSALLPGWGQFYTDNQVQGIVSITLAATSAAALVWSSLDLKEKNDLLSDYIDNDHSTVKTSDSNEDWLNRANKAVKNKNNAVERNNRLIAGLAGVWALNIIDALIVGIIDSKKIKNLYFSFIPAYRGGRPGAGAGVAISF